MVDQLESAPNRCRAIGCLVIAVVANIVQQIGRRPHQVVVMWALVAVAAYTTHRIVLAVDGTNLVAAIVAIVLGFAVARVWSRTVGPWRQISNVDRQWTRSATGRSSQDDPEEWASAARRGIEALDNIEREYALSRSEGIWLWNLRTMMRGYAEASKREQASAARTVQAG